ncbi:MAG TPA: acyl-CoA thioester hydrolase/BAAT C-terminal domain-containing protein [Patescibacteria group bacterium]|nr:acyl-CoA thioester hydrolase/BAAT C-terminal domain-containing protein [Patescibacteria group bacterium]
MNKPCASMVVFMLCIALGTGAAASAAEPTKFEIIATPAVALYGEPFSWKVTGLRPGERVTVKAYSRDAKMVSWESAAVFEADASGEVEIGGRAPVSGSYSGADIFGLLWSMQPENADVKKPINYRNNGIAGWTVNLKAENSTGISAVTRFRCVYQRPNEALVRVPLDQDGLSGFLYYPAEGGPFPGVIILGGSEGGLFEPRARAFAANGFAALTLAYFNYANLPDELVKIPLEYFDSAIAWMKAQPQVDPGRLGIVGGSKGGELALLVASRNSELKAVVAMTPAAHSWEGHSLRFFSPDYQPVSSWSLGGRPLPFVPFKVSAQEKEIYGRGELASFVPFFRDGLAQADAATVAKAAIPVEKIAGPILLISGSDDRIWPAGAFCAAIAARLEKAGFPHQVRHLSIENGGHNSCVPFLITANHGLLIDGDPSGGSPRADAQGGYRSWAETMAFLHRWLDR